jgi:hypothetical protein
MYNLFVLTKFDLCKQLSKHEVVNLQIGGCCQINIWLEDLGQLIIIYVSVTNYLSNWGKSKCEDCL